MAVTLEAPGRLPQESAKSHVPDADMASQCGGVDGCGMRGYTEEGLEVDVNVEGCFDCKFSARKYALFMPAGLMADVARTPDNFVSPYIPEPGLSAELDGWCAASRKL